LTGKHGADLDQIGAIQVH